MQPLSDQLVVGVDFGTLSARALVLRVSDGQPLGTAEAAYRHGVVDRQLPGSVERLPPDWALQVPSDYLAALESAVPAALADAGVDAPQVIAIGTDFTACTVLPTLADGTPLCELADLADRPHAYAKLWKHHAAQGQADRLNRVAHERGEAWIARYGGKLSSEWELAKGLQVLEEDPAIYARMDRWVEASDWIVWQLCGVYVRNVCATGFKAARQDGGYPSEDYLSAVNPEFGQFVRTKVVAPVAQLGARAGDLSREMAARLGLPAGIAVCVGNVDAHVAAPAAQAVAPGQMVAIMGTSTCHIMIGERLVAVPGMCGVVDGGVVPGALGYEAGQSGVGDILAWYVDNAAPAEIADAARTLGQSVHEHLSNLAAQQAVGAHGLVALDWHSGNRSILVDHDLSGLILGLTLQTRPEDIYRALVESTAYGARVIVEAFETAGLSVVDFIAAGGLTKNPFVMQTYADVLGRPIHVIGSEQGPAHGAAMHAAVAAGAYSDIGAAAAAMGRLDRDMWKPDPERAAAYDRLFAIYRRLHDHFGQEVPEIMHDLRAQRRAALSR